MLLRLAVRNLARHRRRTILAGMVFFLATFFLLVNVGAANGMATMMRDSYQRHFTGTVRIRHADYPVEVGQVQSAGGVAVIAGAGGVEALAAAADGVELATSRLSHGMVMQTDRGSAYVTMLAVAPDRMRDGAALLAEAGRLPCRDGEIAVAASQARKLGLLVGDRVRLLTDTPGGAFNLAQYTVVGLIDAAELSMLREQQVVLTLDAGQELLRAPDVATEITLRLEPGASPDDVRAAIAGRLAGTGLCVDTWAEAGKSVVESQGTLRLSIIIVYALSLLIVLAVAFNLMYITLFERFLEIGTMLALGCDRGRVLVMFLLEGTVLGLASSALGAVAGFLAMAALGQGGIAWGTTLAAIFGGTVLRPELSAAAVLPVVLVMSCAGALATLVPGWRATNIDPATAFSRA